MMKPSPLLHRKHNLSDPLEQVRFLDNGIFGQDGFERFDEKLMKHGQWPLKPEKLDIVQVNVGYMCNQVCAHCHVDAGPQRKEIMTRDTMQHVLRVLAATGGSTLDITGGAPEMNPDFRWFVEEAAKTGVSDIIVRSNLTILMAGKAYEDLPEFFKKHRVHVVSSLPYYKRERTDKQRGSGVFDRSISALQRLNAEGYGMEGSGLKLDLVYNPAGAFLPGSQEALERDFKKNLLEDFGIHFNALFCITNLPVSRFLEYLINSGNYEDYMETLVQAYNPAAVPHVMCRNTLSVGYDGTLYDCDFNQMLRLEIDGPVKHIAQFGESALESRQIRTGQHCYGCTAGAGSSCQGSIA